jgi:hypothetical protein
MFIAAYSCYQIMSVLSNGERRRIKEKANKIIGSEFVEKRTLF